MTRKGKRKTLCWEPGSITIIQCHLQIEDSFEEHIVANLVERIFKEHPDYSIHEMIPILVNWYKSKEVPLKKSNDVITKVKEKDWLDLDVNDSLSIRPP